MVSFVLELSFVSPHAPRASRVIQTSNARRVFFRKVIRVALSLCTQLSMPSGYGVYQGSQQNNHSCDQGLPVRIDANQVHSVQSEGQEDRADHSSGEPAASAK